MVSGEVNEKTYYEGKISGQAQNCHNHTVSKLQVGGSVGSTSDF